MELRLSLEKGQAHEVLGCVRILLVLDVFWIWFLFPSKKIVWWS